MGQLQRKAGERQLGGGEVARVSGLCQAPQQGGRDQGSAGGGCAPAQPEAQLQHAFQQPGAAEGAAVHQACQQADDVVLRMRHRARLRQEHYQVQDQQVAKRPSLYSQHVAVSQLLVGGHNLRGRRSMLHIQVCALGKTAAALANPLSIGLLSRAGGCVVYLHTNGARTHTAGYFSQAAWLCSAAERQPRQWPTCSVLPPPKFLHLISEEMAGILSVSRSSRTCAVRGREPMSAGAPEP
jgi:hypothetical protein